MSDKFDVSRRNFLKFAAVGAAGAGVAASGLVGCAPAAPKDNGSAAGAGDAAASESGELIAAAKLNPQDYDYRSNDRGLTSVFSGWKLGPIELGNRIVKSAAGSATYLAGFTDELYQYYLNFAKGGVEMIWVEGEAFAMPADGSAVPAETVDFFKRLTEECATYGSHLGFQWAPFGLPVTEDTMTVEMIKGIEAAGAALAAQLKSMGFVGLEINAAGFNQGHQFLSRFYNTRTDEYGAATPENRARFVSECIQAIKDACGKDFVVQVLMEPMEENDNLTNDCSLMTLDNQVTAPHNSATTMEEGIAMAQAMEAAGADSFHLRLGPLGNHPCQFGNDLYFILNGVEGANGYGRQWDFKRHWQGKLIGNHSGAGMLMDVVAAFKEKISVPVGCVTYMDPAHAPDYFDQAIADGKIDFMMMTRPLTVEPEYVTKLREGRIDEIAPCTRCLHCHIGSNEMNRASGYCRVNALTQRVMTENGPATYELPAAQAAKKVMVVGAGPAGLEAAHVAAKRGHQVTLFEKSGTTGGLLSFASLVKGPHENLDDLSAYLLKQCELAGVTVKTGTEVTADTIKGEAPDALVVAVGGVRPELEVEGANVVKLEDFMTAELGDNVVVYGSSAQAFDAALWLTVRGHKVTIVTPNGNAALDEQQSQHAHRFMTTTLYSMGVKVYTDSQVKSCADGKLTVHSDLMGVDAQVDCDAIVNAGDVQPNTALAEGSGVSEVYTIGDAAAPFNIAMAIRSGNDCGRAL